jgi:hypothetical protein
VPGSQFFGAPPGPLVSPEPGEGLVGTCQERKLRGGRLLMRTLSDHWVHDEPLLQREGARQQAARVEGQALPPAQDQAAGHPPTEARRTPRRQERRDMHKGLRQGRQGAAQRGHRGLDMHRPLEPQRRGGTDQARGVGQKDIRPEANVAPPPFKGVGHNLAALGNDKRGLEGEIAGVPPPPRTVVVSTLSSR